MGRAQQISEAAGLLLFNSGVVYRRLRANSQRFGVRFTAITVMKDLELNGPMSQRELAELERLSAPSISLLVRDLEKEGLILRAPDPKDGRSTLVSLSDLGSERLERDGALMVEDLHELMESFSDSELACILKAEELLAKQLAIGPSGDTLPGRSSEPSP